MTPWGRSPRGHPRPRPPNPRSPPPCLTPSPLRRRVPWLCPGARAVARCPSPPCCPRGRGDRAAAAGARSRNGHGWAGTAAPRLRARGQEQLVHRLSLTSPPVAAPAWRCHPGTKPPASAAETPGSSHAWHRHQRREPGRAPWRVAPVGSKASVGISAGGHGVGTAATTVAATASPTGWHFHPARYLGERSPQNVRWSFFIYIFFPPFLLKLPKICVS